MKRMKRTYGREAAGSKAKRRDPWKQWERLDAAKAKAKRAPSEHDWTEADPWS